jgi:hypothetical protein
MHRFERRCINPRTSRKEKKKMVPPIQAIAMNIPEAHAATRSAEAIGMTPAGDTNRFPAPSMASSDARRTAFSDDVSSRGAEWIARVEDNARQSNLELDREIGRMWSSGPLQPADALRLRASINANAERIALGKKISDSLVQGVQTLARG